MTVTSEPSPIGRQLRKANHLAACLFYRGIVDLFHNPRAAGHYWRSIAGAALQPAESASVKFLGLPRRNINDIIPEVESIPVTLIEYQYAYGDMPVHELMMLCRIVRYRQPNVVFEIGTYLGGTTLQLAANSQAEIYTLDLPPRSHKDYVQPQIWDPDSDVYPDRPGVRFQDSPYKDRIVQLFGDSQTFDFSSYYGRVDFMFIDGCHHYDFVIRDSRNALKMISPDGIVIWHDYASYAPGVVKALNEFGKLVPLKHIAGTTLVMHQR